MTAQTVTTAQQAPQSPPHPAAGDGVGDAAAEGVAEALEQPRGPSLSPSRAADFKTCPLLFRFRTIDRLPSLPTADQVRGTLVHAVLERLFDLPAAERTPAAAAALVEPQWERLLEQEPSLADLFAEAPAGPAAGGAVPAGPPGDEIPATPAGPPGAEAGADQLALVDVPAWPADEAARLAAFLSGAGALLDGYFAVEDPTRLEPAERESLVSTLVDDELLIRGYIDRLDISPAGDLRVVDYKTGGAPREAFEGRALFQLKFYALVLWRTRGVVPRVLRLLYLKDAEILDYSPDAEELERFERTLVALSQAVERAKRDRDFRPKPSRLCGWCSYQAFCPEFGGTPPPYPEPAATDTVPPADPMPAPATAASLPVPLADPVLAPATATSAPVPAPDPLLAPVTAAADPAPAPDPVLAPTTAAVHAAADPTPRLATAADPAAAPLLAHPSGADEPPADSASAISAPRAPEPAPAHQRAVD